MAYPSTCISLCSTNKRVPRCWVCCRYTAQYGVYRFDNPYYFNEQPKRATDLRRYDFLKQNFLVADPDDPSKAYFQGFHFLAGKWLAAQLH